MEHQTVFAEEAALLALARTGGRGIRQLQVVRSLAHSEPPTADPDGEMHTVGSTGEVVRSHQESFPVFLDLDEQAISEQSVVRFIAWLRAEIERIPEWHPLRHEYRQQLRSLTRRRPLGPQGLVSSGG